MLLRRQALPRPAFRGFLDRYGIAVRQLYGSTEAGVMTINVDPDPVATAASVGTPAAGVEVVVVDDDGLPVPAGEEGELAVRGPAITRGYADMEELNRETFRDGYYFTGDLGRLDAEGRVFVTGRKKLFIEVAGHKVDPVEVEDVLAAHPKVREAVVVGVKGKVEGEEIVKAAVVTAGELRPARADHLLPGAPGQLQGAPDRRVPRGDPEEPAGQDPSQVPDRVAAQA